MTAPPWRSVAFLTPGDPTFYHWKRCSGVLLSRTLVLTAASCLYVPKDPSQNYLQSGWRTRLSVDLASTPYGRPPPVSSYATAFHVPSAFITAAKIGYTEAAAKHDYAIVSLETPMDMSFPYLGRDTSKSWTGNVTAAGYAIRVYYHSHPKGFSSRCNVRLNGTSPLEFIPCDFYEGQKGGPVWRDRSSVIKTPWAIVGILLQPKPGGGGRIRRIDADVETFIRQVQRLPVNPCKARGLVCGPNQMCTTDGKRPVCSGRTNCPCLSKPYDMTSLGEYCCEQYKDIAFNSLEDAVWMAGLGICGTKCDGITGKAPWYAIRKGTSLRYSNGETSWLFTGGFNCSCKAGDKDFQATRRTTTHTTSTRSTTSKTQTFAYVRDCTNYPITLYGQGICAGMSSVTNPEFLDPRGCARFCCGHGYPLPIFIGYEPTNGRCYCRSAKLGCSLDTSIAGYRVYSVASAPIPTATTSITPTKTATLTFDLAQCSRMPFVLKARDHICGSAAQQPAFPEALPANFTVEWCHSTCCKRGSRPPFYFNFEAKKQICQCGRAYETCGLQSLQSRTHFFVPDRTRTTTTKTLTTAMMTVT